MSNNIGEVVNPGGVAPSGAQTALSTFTRGQGLLANAARYGGTGMGHSTMESAGTSGPQAGFALQQGEQSLADTQAMVNFANSQFKDLASGLGGILGKFG